MENRNNHEIRVESGMRSGIIGVLANFVLALIKFIAGITAGSVSILADALNSVGDSASALLTVIGFYIASKPADREHPYGHERAEYISGLIIAIIILVVGFEFLMNSIDKILNPTSVENSRLVMILLLVSIFIKIILGIYYRSLNDNLPSKSGVIEALVKDSFNDAMMTSVIIISYLIEIEFGWYIDGYVGAVVALLILYSGIISIVDSSNDLIGTRPNQELIREMQEVLDSYDAIIGYHDLMVHKYGPHKLFVTVDIEIESSWTLIEAHKILDEIEKEFEEKFNSKTVCHLDPIVLDDDLQNAIYFFVKKTLKSYDSEFHFHDFRVIEEKMKKEIQFDVVVPTRINSSDESLYNILTSEIKNEFPEFEIIVNFDRHYILDE